MENFEQGTGTDHPRVYAGGCRERNRKRFEGTELYSVW